MEDTNSKDEETTKYFSGSNPLESLEFYKDFIEYSSIGFLKINHEKKIKTCNSSAAYLFGYEKDEFLNLSIFKIFSQMKIEVMNEDEFIKKFMNNELIENLEAQVRKKNGELIWLKFSIKPLLNSQGEYVGNYFVGLDITKKKKVEYELAKSDEKYKSIFHSINSGVVVYEARNEGSEFIIKDFNKAAEIIEGVNKEEVIGKNVLNAFPGVKDFGLFKIFQRVWRTGIPEKHPLSYYRDNRRNGWRENYIYKLSSGEIVAIYDNLTDKVSHDQILTEILERFRLITSSVNDAIVQLDQNGKIIFWNKAAQEIFGYTSKEILGKNLQIILAPNSLHEAPLDTFPRLLTSGTGEAIGKNVELKGLKKNGKEIPIEFSLSRVQIEGKWNSIGIIRDISERKTHEKSLNQVLNFEKMITSISSKFVGQIDFDKAIGDTLRNIGISKMLSRVFLFSFDDNKEYMNNTHEWCDEGIEPHMEFYNKTPINDIPDAMENIFKGKYISVEDSSDLTSGAIKLKKMLSEQNVKATLAYPISIHENISGFIGFDDEKSSRFWNPEDYSLLKITSQIIGNVLERKVAENNLKESEEKYRLISEDSDDLIVVRDENLTLDYLNEKAHSRVLGYPSHLFWKQSFRNSLVHEDDVERIGATAKEGYKKGYYKLQVRHRHFKGHYLWFERTGKTFYDKNGVKKMLIVGRDITDIKLAEQKTKESEEKNRSLIEGLTRTGMGLDIVSIDHKILYQNTVLKEKFGNIVGKECYSNYIGIDEPCSFCPMEKAIETRKTQRAEVFGNDMRTYELISAPLPNADGTVDKAIEVIVDITEKKIAEQKLKESEEKYRNILESIKEGYYEVDLKGKFTFINDAICEITGYTREEILNSNYIELYDEHTRKYLAKEFNDLYNKGKGYKILEYQQIKKNKESLYLELSIYLKFDSNKIVTGFKGVVRDVSERKKSEALKKQFNQKLEEEVDIRTIELAEALEKQRLYLDQIIKASQFKTEFLATMSHELRTPLNAIIGFTDLLLEGVYGNLNAEQLEFVNDIKSSAEHQFEMITHILDISKIESGQTYLKTETFQLYDLMEILVSTLKPLLNEKNLKFEMVGFNKKIKIRADRLKIKQIVYNLITNAIKFTEKGSIVLEFRENEKEWEFKVSDTGIGIAKADFDIIFKDFKRVKSNYVDSTSGSGLGLALTKRIVELHGGMIDFNSTLGEGSSFRFTIPKDPLDLSQFDEIEKFLRRL